MSLDAGRADLIARRDDGDLYLYRGTGTGGWICSDPEQIGNGWQPYDAMAVAGGSWIADEAAQVESLGSVCGEPVVEEGPELAPTAADIATWDPETRAEAAAVGTRWRCKEVLLKESYVAGKHRFRGKWCFNRGSDRVRTTSVHETWFDGNQPYVTLYEVGITDRQPESYVDGSDGAAVEGNLSTWERCTRHIVVCFDKTDRFRIRGYHTGGYEWRVNDRTGSSGTIPN